jgi:hypothetical protein
VLVDGKEFPGAGMSDGPGIRVGAKGSGLVYRTKEDDNIVRVFVNGAQGPDLSRADLGALAFSPDESSAAFPALDMKGMPVLVVGKQAHALPENALSGFVFPEDQNRRIQWSPDGRHFATISGRKTLLDGKPGPDCNRGTLPLFSADSKHLAFVCPERGKSGVGEQWAIYIDGQRGQAVDAVFLRQPGTWGFKPDGTLSVLALVGAEVQELNFAAPAGGLTAWAGGQAPPSAAQNARPTAGEATATQLPPGGDSPTSTSGNPLEEKTKTARDKLKKKLPGIFN